MEIVTHPCTVELRLKYLESWAKLAPQECERSQFDEKVFSFAVNRGNSIKTSYITPSRHVFPEWDDVLVAIICACARRGAECIVSMRNGCFESKIAKDGEIFSWGSTAMHPGWSALTAYIGYLHYLSNWDSIEKMKVL